MIFDPFKGRVLFCSDKRPVSQGFRSLQHLCKAERRLAFWFGIWRFYIIVHV